MSLYVGDRLACRFGQNVQICIPDGQSDIYRYRIDIIDSLDDDHMAARNM